MNFSPIRISRLPSYPQYADMNHQMEDDMRTASWVIRDKASKAVVCETFNVKLVATLNTAKYEAVPILEYLASLNNR